MHSPNLYLSAWLQQAFLLCSPIWSSCFHFCPPTLQVQHNSWGELLKIEISSLYSNAFPLSLAKNKPLPLGLQALCGLAPVKVSDICLLQLSLLASPQAPEISFYFSNTPRSFLTQSPCVWLPGLLLISTQMLLLLLSFSWSLCLKWTALCWSYYGMTVFYFIFIKNVSLSRISTWLFLVCLVIAHLSPIQWKLKCSTTSFASFTASI